MNREKRIVRMVRAPPTMLGRLVGVAVALYALGGCTAPVTGMRVATYNAQFRVAPVTSSECCEWMGEDRIEHLARRILASSYDVVVLQEVFDDVAQNGLADRLKIEFPHFVKYIDGNSDHFEVVGEEPDSWIAGLPPLTYNPCEALVGADLCGDSGLALFSRHPFVELPASADTRIDPSDLRAESDGDRWDDVGFLEYEVCRGNDCFANKGAALVRIQHPSSQIYNIVFTHTDAGSAELDRGVRIVQLRTIRNLIERTLPDANRASEHILVMGDLNIDGNHRLAARPEWESHMAPGTAGSHRFFHDVVRDAWEFDLQAPAVPMENRDTGLTATSIDPQKRLDYILMNSPTDPVINGTMCIQHVVRALDLFAFAPEQTTAFGDGGPQPLSDHIGVGIELNRPELACSPTEPIIVAEAMFDRPDSTATLSGPDITLRHRGSAQWFFVQTPGTYTIRVSAAGPDPIQFHVYRPQEMSIPVQPDGDFADPVRVIQEGLRYHFAEPNFYVKVFSDEDDPAGTYTLSIHKHRCLTRQDACLLAAHSDPLEQVEFRGPELWFEINTDSSFSGRLQTLEFVAHDLVGGTAPSSQYELELRDEEGMRTLANTSPGSPARLVRDRAGDERTRRYLIVRKSSASSPDQLQVGWTTTLRLLQLVGMQALELADDFTGEFEDDRVRFQAFLEQEFVFDRNKRILLGDFNKNDYRAFGSRLPCPIGYLVNQEPLWDPQVVLEERDDLDPNDWLIGGFSSRPPDEFATLREAEDSGRPPTPSGVPTPSGNGYRFIDSDVTYRMRYRIFFDHRAIPYRAATRVNGRLYCELLPLFRDRDGDGIDDGIDTVEGHSNSFTDRLGGLAGNTAGEIIDRGNRRWWITDEPDFATTLENDGVRIRVSPGSRPGSVVGTTFTGGPCAPLPTLTFPPSTTESEAVYSCGSTYIRVHTGTVILRNADNERVSVLSEGDILHMDPR